MLVYGKNLRAYDFTRFYRQHIVVRHLSISIFFNCLQHSTVHDFPGFFSVLCALHFDRSEIWLRLHNMTVTVISTDIHIIFRTIFRDILSEMCLSENSRQMGKCKNNLHANIPIRHLPLYFYRDDDRRSGVKGETVTT